MQPMQGRCCAGSPTTATLCTQALPGSLQVSGDATWALVESLRLALGCRRCPRTATGRLVTPALLPGQALKPHTGPQQALCEAFCTNLEITVCAGAPALHLLSESTTVWLCALTAVPPFPPGKGSVVFTKTLCLRFLAIFTSQAAMAKRECDLQSELSHVLGQPVNVRRTCANRRTLTCTSRAESPLARPAATASKGVQGRLCSALTAVTTTSLDSRCMPLQHLCHSFFRTAGCDTPVQHSQPTANMPPFQNSGRDATWTCVSAPARQAGARHRSAQHPASTNPVAFPKSSTRYPVLGVGK